MVKIKRVLNPVTGKVYEFDIPLDLYYSNFHTYAKIISKDLVKVGFDDYAQQVLGAFWTPQILPVRTSVKQFESLGSVRCQKLRQRILSPISGEIVEMNSLLNENPKLMNTDPYGKGWIVKLTPTSNLDAELKRLHTGKKAVKWLEEELDKFLERQRVF